MGDPEDNEVGDKESDEEMVGAGQEKAVKVRKI